MDLATLDTRTKGDSGTPINLLHPVTNVPLKTRIILLGADSAVYRDTEREIHRRFQQILKTNRKAIRTPEGIEADHIELLVSVTKGWTDLQLNGQDFSYSPANARTLYTDYPWVREQVDHAINDRANFLPNCATS